MFGMQMMIDEERGAPSPLYLPGLAGVLEVTMVVFGWSPLTCIGSGMYTAYELMAWSNYSYTYYVLVNPPGIRVLCMYKALLLTDVIILQSSITSCA